MKTTFCSNLRVVILHSDDPPATGSSIVLDGGDVKRLDSEGVQHTDVDSLIMKVEEGRDVTAVTTFSASVSAALRAS